jgi:hypothetical protein
MATPRSLEAARHQPRPSTHACASGSRVRQSRGHHFCWNEPSVFALKIRRPARAFDLHAHPGTRPVLGSQCPSPEALVRGTTERAETHISGPNVRATPASAHGPGVSQCPCLKEPGPWRDGRNYPRGGPQGRRPRASASAKLARSHLCQQAACFLPCTRPPDFALSRMTPWLLLLTISLPSMPQLLSSATCSP